MRDKIMRQHIFKVQIPLESNQDDPPALVYNEHRDIIGEVAMTQELLDLFPEDTYKIYALGTISQAGVVDIVELVPDQEW